MNGFLNILKPPGMTSAAVVAVVRRLTGEGGQFDLVFLDPPYKMHDLREVFAALKPLMAEDAVILLEHDSAAFPAVADGYALYDSRKYGAAGVSFFRMMEVEG